MARLVHALRGFFARKVSKATTEQRRDQSSEDCNRILGSSTGLTEQNDTSKATRPQASNDIGELMPRELIISIGGGWRKVTIKDLAKELPRIDPPSDPLLCDSCKELTFESSIQYDKEVRKDATGKISTTSVSIKSHVAISWPSPRRSFERCPMCRLLACLR